MQSPDPKLDAKLRAVPLPAGLLDRLRALPFAEDDDLDAALREVHVPQGLTKWLRDIPLADDDGLDEALRDVRVPARLAASWKRRSGKQDRLLRLGRMMVAVSVVAALTLAYIATLLMAPESPMKTDGNPLTAKTEPPLKSSWDGEYADNGLDWPSPHISPEVDSPKSEPRRIVQVLPGLFPLPDDPLAVPMPGRVFGRYDSEEDLFRRVTGLPARGLEWPAVRGANSDFLAFYKTHPFVLPAADPQLQSLVVPLNAGTASYELTRRYLEGEIKTRGRKGKEGDWPPHDQVRTEDFINALNEAYDYPRPDRQALGLSIVAGPSPFRGPGYCLVQVGVQARSAPAQKRQPVHLVIAIDTSGSMQWGGRVEMVQRALRELIKQVEPDDRLSLVSFSDRAQVLVEDAGPAEVGHFLAAVDWLSAGGTTNSTAGLGDAFATAQQQNSPQRPARVVLLTDGLLELGTDPKVTAVLQQRVMDAAARGLPLHVIDLGQGTYTDPDLASLALSGQGTVHRAESAEQIRWSLQEILTGRSQIVAHGAQLKVAFNPKTVLEYRLLGYELGPGGAAPSRTDFRDGQSSTVLYEIRLALNAGGQVATAELMWYGMDANRPNERDQQRAARALDVKEFAASFDKAAPSLQAAALVAQTAEIFRRSPFVRHLRGGPTPMHLVEQMARQADSHLYQRAAFTEFLSMLELATKSPRVGQAGPRK